MRLDHPLGVVLGVMVGTQRAARRMRDQGDGGSIVNTTSIGGINAGPGVMAYRASKAAVIHFTRSAAVELAALGIRVNCIAPAHIPTAINIPAETFAVKSDVLPKEKKIIVYCNTGSRSYIAYRKLGKLAYPRFYQALFADWKEAKLPVEKK